MNWINELDFLSLMSIQWNKPNEIHILIIELEEVTALTSLSIYLVCDCFRRNSITIQQISLVNTALVSQIHPRFLIVLIAIKIQTTFPQHAWLICT